MVLADLYCEVSDAQFMLYSTDLRAGVWPGLVALGTLRRGLQFGIDISGKLMVIERQKGFCSENYVRESD